MPLLPLHVPQGQTINQEYYCQHILEGNLLDIMEKTELGGSVLTCRLVPDIFGMVFQQDGARSHAAARIQTSLEEKISQFWTMPMWQANSPDLSSNENLWSILRIKQDEQISLPTSIPAMEKSLTKACKKISQETLYNLIYSMPDRVKPVILAKGHFPVV